MVKNKRFSRAFLLFLCVSLSACSFDNFKSGVVSVWNDVVDTAIEIGEPIIDKITAGCSYVYDNVAHFTQETYETINAKANELIGNVQDYLVGIDDKNKTPDIQYGTASDKPIKDLSAGQEFSDTYGLNHVDDGRSKTEDFATYYLSSVFSEMGYSVLNAAAFYKGATLSGLAFTKNDSTIEQDGKVVYTCGFAQIVSDSYEGTEVTEDMVETGLVVAPTYNNEEIEHKDGYIVKDFATIDPLGGVYDNHYFEYSQKSRYVVSVKVTSNDTKNYSDSIEIYDFDNEKIIRDGAKTVNDEVSDLCSDDEESYLGAVMTTNAMADMSEQASAEYQIATAGVLDIGFLDDASEKGSSFVLDKLAEWYKNSPLSDNQFFCVTETGIRFLGKDYALAKERTTNGLISAIGSGLGAAGSVATLVFALSASGIVVKSIILTAGVSAVVYNISNLIEGVDNVYYGTKNDTISEADNPVLQAFEKNIGDDEKAKTIYHAWGIGSTLIAGLMIPASKALSIARCNGLNSFSTFAYVLRASLVTIAKGLASALGAAFIGSYVNKIVSYITTDNCMGRLFGFGASLISGILIFKGLDNLDKKINLSGLYPKAKIKRCFEYEDEQNKDSIIKQKDFKSLSNGQKEDIARIMKEEAVKQYGIKNDPSIEYVYDYDNKGLYGYYNHSTNTITINMCSPNGTSWAELADTIGHEMRHCYQWQCVESDPNSEFTYSLVDHYISPNVDYDGYIHQLCEVDASNYGAWFSNWVLSAIGAI